MQNKIITHINFAKGFRGGERQTQLLIQELSNLGYIQKLLLRKGSKLTQKCKNIKNLTIIEVNKPYILNIKHIKGSAILHAHETKAAQFAYFANRLTKIPYIITRRVDNAIKNNFFNKKIYENAKFSVALSNAIKNELLKISKNIDVKIIPSAYTDHKVDLENVKKLKNRFKNKFLVGHVGALDDKHKNQSLIIKLAKELKDTHKDIHFILVGGGDDEKRLKELAKDLPNVTFIGFVNNVQDYITIFDIFIFPSNNEGLGSTLLDVINAQVPIIASKVGGILDIIQHNENGILCDVNIEVFKNALLELYKDSKKRLFLAKNAKNNLTRYSTNSMAQSYIKLYNSI